MDQDGAVAQLGERGLCKPEVVGSIPISSTNPERVIGEQSSPARAAADFFAAFLGGVLGRRHEGAGGIGTARKFLFPADRFDCRRVL